MRPSQFTLSGARAAGSCQRVGSTRVRARRTSIRRPWRIDPTNSRLLGELDAAISEDSVDAIGGDLEQMLEKLPRGFCDLL